jgi:hypothetical protein
VAQLVPLGTTVTAPDLETVSVNPAAGLAAIPLRDAAQVVGRRAAVALEPGALLVQADLASGPGLPAGKALVGASLSVGQLPVELAAGQAVLVVLSGTGGSGGASGPGSGSGSGSTVASPTAPAGSILSRAIVISVSDPSTASASAGAATATFVVTLEVPDEAAAAVAAASAAGDVSLAVMGGSS